MTLSFPSCSLFPSRSSNVYSTSPLPQPAAVIVENTFLDMPSLVPHFVKPLAFLTFLLHQIWPSAERLATVPGDLPMLFLSGGKDEIVPKQQMADVRRALSPFSCPAMM